MTADHTLIAHGADSLDRVLFDLGFGIVAGSALVVLLVALGAKPGRIAIIFLTLGATALFMSVSAWAQRLDFTLNPEIVKIVAIVVAVGIIGWVALTIVQRAPPAALLACFAMLLVCGLLIALSWAPTHNLFLLIVGLLIMGVLAAFGLVVWAQIRMAEHRQIVIPQAPHAPQIEPREIDRGPLLAAPRGARALQPYQQRNRSCQKS